MKTLKAIVSVRDWSYIVNENGNSVRATLIGYGSCTPAPALQGWIDKMSPEEFEKIWQECETRRDIQD